MSLFATLPQSAPRGKRAPQQFHRHSGMVTEPNYDNVPRRLSTQPRHGRRGVVAVHSEELLQTLVADGAEQAYEASMREATAKSAQTHGRRADQSTAGGASEPHTALDAVMRQKTPANQRAEQQRRREELKKAKEEQYRMEIEELKTEAKRRLEDTAKHREEKFNLLNDRLQRERETLVKPIEEYLEQVESADTRKKEKLCQEWNEKVFAPIQKQIMGKIDAAPGSTSRRVRYSARKLDDPVRKDIIKQNREREFRGEPIVDKGRSREVLEMGLWNKLDSTPYCDRIEKADRKSKIGQAGNRRNNSNVPFDHFTHPTGAEALKDEVPKGKKTFRDWKPSQSKMDTRPGAEIHHPRWLK